MWGGGGIVSDCYSYGRGIYPVSADPLYNLPKRSQMRFSSSTPSMVVGERKNFPVLRVKVRNILVSGRLNDRVRGMFMTNFDIYIK